MCKFVEYLIYKQCVCYNMLLLKYYSPSRFVYLVYFVAGFSAFLRITNV